MCVCVLCGHDFMMLGMNETPTDDMRWFCTVHEGYVKVNYKTLNSAVMLLRPNRPYPILWLEVALVSCGTT